MSETAQQCFLEQRTVLDPAAQRKVRPDLPIRGFCQFLGGIVERMLRRGEASPCRNRPAGGGSFSLSLGFWVGAGSRSETM